MKTIAIALLLAAATAAHADTFGLHIGSRHLPNDEKLNSFNPGAYWRSDAGHTVGAYWNSERRLSVYAGHTFGRGRAQLTLGAVTGYQYGTLSPLVVPSVRFGDIRVAFLPRTPKSVSTVHLMWEFRS